ncbi:MAG: amino acid ABC transporter permease [Pseudomonadota bacterium]
MANNTKSSIAYVAREELPALPAPISVSGPAGWIRQNLFPTWKDGILTIVFGIIILWGLAALVPWLFINSVWVADSLRECREINSEGACFAVVTSRIDQLIYGFYPQELQWRPILTFFLMFLAFAPVLHDNLPRKLLWFTGIFPLLAYWLLWGGAIWGILLVIAAIVASVVVFNIIAKTVNPTIGLIAAFLFLCVWFIFGQAATSEYLTGTLGFVGLEPVETSRFGGFLLTFIIGVTGIVASLPLGIILALGRKSDLPVLKLLCTTFIEFIRGVPLITLLFVASTLLNYFLPPGTTFDIVLRVIIMVTLFASAYMAEVIRGGLAALPRGQYEAADALGLNYSQATQLIILPQALKISIPGIVNTFIGLFKDTVLVSIVGLLDPVGMMQPIRSTSEWNGIIWELPIFIGLVFFIFCFLMSRYSMYFERKLDTGHRN